MNIKLPVLTKRIFDLGSYAKPILYFLLDNKIDFCYKSYLKSLNYIWKREYKKADEELNLGLKKCKQSKSIYYLLLSNKFIISYYLNDSKTLKIIYSQLRKEYKKIPPTVRKIISQFLINYSLLKNDTDLPKSRFWSKDKELSQSTKLFILIGKARKKIKEGMLEEAISYYQKSLKIALKIPHPSGIITCYNDISWYLRDTKPLRSLYNAEKGLYYLGNYFEEPKTYFYILDTLFNIYKKLNYYRIYEISEFINLYKDDDFIKNRYINLLKNTKNYIINFEKNSYKNSFSLRNYLNKKIKNVKKTSKLTKISRDKLIKILNGKTKKIRSKTIRKFINGLNIDIEKGTPNQIFSELIKIKIDSNCQRSIENLSNKTYLEKNKLILSTFMALFIRKKIFKYLVKKDVLKEILYLINSDSFKFNDLVNKRYEIKRFVSYIINPPNFIKGRRDLILKFLDKLDEEKLNIIIDYYFNINENEREIIDVFIRNYIRFEKISINFGLDQKINLKIKDIVDFLNLNFNSFILSYYYFSKWERVKFNRIISKLEILIKDFRLKLKA